MTEPEVFEVLRKLRYDLTAAQTKVTQALNLLASMPLPVAEVGTFRCSCGRVFLHERELALHMQNVHNGPAVPLDEAELEA